jgi:hypothetical protein
LEQSLETCGLAYFDMYLLHAINDGSEAFLQDKDMLAWILDAKKRGKVKHIGFSFHGTTAFLEKFLQKYPEMEFVFLQLNYMDVLCGQAGEWLEVAQKYKIPVIAMEPVKGGALAELPAPAEALLKAHAPECSIASWAVRYVAGLSGVCCVLSGMSTIEQMDDNLRTFADIQTLSAQEQKILGDALVEMGKIANIPCTRCKYCLKSCPQGIAIDTCFVLYNELKRGTARWNCNILYKNISNGKKAADCTGCGACVPRCPQGLDIPKELKTVAEEMAK